MVGNHNHSLCTNQKGLLLNQAVPLYFPLSSHIKHRSTNIDIYRRFNTIQQTKNTQQLGKEFERWFYQMLFQLCTWNKLIKKVVLNPKKTVNSLRSH